MRSSTSRLSNDSKGKLGSILPLLSPSAKDFGVAGAGSVAARRAASLPPLGHSNESQAHRSPGSLAFFKDFSAIFQGHSQPTGQRTADSILQPV